MKKSTKRFGVFCLVLSMLFSVCALGACGAGTFKPPSFDDAKTVRIMSYNIMVGNDDERVQSALKDAILAERPDVLGVQEADIAWLNYLDDNLTGYVQAQECRDGVTIYYRTEKYNLIQSGIFWYSLTPTKTSYLLSNARYARPFMFAKLQDKQTGDIFVYFNTHLDYGNPNNARNQAKILTEYAKIFKDYPIFITGDLNQTPDSIAIEQFRQNFVDSSEVEGADVVGTYHA